MVTFTSHSPEETQALGEAWGREARKGWIIGLTGDLGAGKTQLVKGIARGLGIRAGIHSPTFALVHEYGEGRLPLAHLDLYRLDTIEQIIGAGLHEYCSRPPGVVVIEWCERWPEFNRALGMPRKTLQGHAQQGEGDRLKSKSAASPHLRLVWIETVSETDRRITYEDAGD